jgi:hypothetical protein
LLAGRSFLGHHAEATTFLYGFKDGHVSLVLPVLGAFAVALVKLIEVILRIAKTEDMVEVLLTASLYCKSQAGRIVQMADVFLRLLRYPVLDECASLRYVACAKEP